MERNIDRRSVMMRLALERVLSLIEMTTGLYAGVIGWTLLFWFKSDYIIAAGIVCFGVNQVIHTYYWIEEDRVRGAGSTPRGPYLSFPDFDFAVRLFPNANLTRENYETTKTVYNNLISGKILSIEGRRRRGDEGDRKSRSLALMQEAIVTGTCSFNHDPHAER